jgi:hypothetical protein
MYVLLCANYAFLLQKNIYRIQEASEEIRHRGLEIDGPRRRRGHRCLGIFSTFTQGWANLELHPATGMNPSVHLPVCHDVPTAPMIFSSLTLDRNVGGSNTPVKLIARSFHACQSLKKQARWELNLVSLRQTSL